MLNCACYTVIRDGRFKPPLTIPRCTAKHMQEISGSSLLVDFETTYPIVDAHYDLFVGFKTPAEAIEGTYVDKKCPFTSDVSIRGRILK